MPAVDGCFLTFLQWEIMKAACSFLVKFMATWSLLCCWRFTRDSFQMGPIVLATSYLVNLYLTTCLCV